MLWKILNPFGLQGEDLKKWNVFVLFVLAIFACSCVFVTLFVIGTGTLVTNWPF